MEYVAQIKLTYLKYIIFIFSKDTISVHRPGFYAQRFMDFMSKTVFRKIPSRKSSSYIINCVIIFMSMLVLTLHSLFLLKMLYKLGFYSKFNSNFF